MTYKLAFFILLAFWAWGANAFARQGMEPAGVAVFSLCCGYLSRVVYMHGWKPSTKTEEAFAQVSSRLLLPTIVMLLIFFAVLVLAYNHLATYTRSILIAAGFYFLTYWLSLRDIARKSVAGG